MANDAGSSYADDHSETTDEHDDASTETAEEHLDDDASTATEHDENKEDAIFARLRALTSGKREIEDEAPAPKPVERTAIPETRVEASTAGHAGEESEESIDNYMQRLLSRMRGESGTATESRPQAAAAKRETVQVAEQVEEQAAKPKREYVRSEAPEKKVDLVAMRALANSTARDAVDTSRNRIAAGKALTQMVYGGATLVLCALGTYLIPEDSETLRMAGFAGMCGSMVWLGLSLVRSRPLFMGTAKRDVESVVAGETAQVRNVETKANDEVVDA
ncbi:MAG: hypothetical protein QM811_23155 [Pirellulales bacterium]